MGDASLKLDRPRNFITQGEKKRVVDWTLRESAAPRYA